MNKILVKVISDTCEDCPYCRWMMSLPHKDSGYDCWHPSVDIKRIVDDKTMDEKTKFNGWPGIPKGCPLPDLKDDTLMKLREMEEDNDNQSSGQ